MTNSERMAAKKELIEFIIGLTDEECKIFISVFQKENKEIIDTTVNMCYNTQHINFRSK